MTTIRWPDGETRNWTGYNRSLCYTCRRLFGGVSGFEKHRRNDTCLDPATLGMVEKDGIWTQDVGDAFSKDALAAEGLALKAPSKTRHG